jgi:hypothetical protein
MQADELEPVPELPLPRVQAAIDIDPWSNLLFVCDPDTISHAATNMTLGVTVGNRKCIKRTRALVKYLCIPAFHLNPIMSWKYGRQIHCTNVISNHNLSSK